MNTFLYLHNVLPILRSLPIRRAGIIPYTFYKKEFFIIFGLERGIGSISDFGGTYERADGDLINTALREYREETLDLFPMISREELINLNPPCLYNETTFEILLPLVFDNIYQFTISVNNTLRHIPESEIYSIFFISLPQLNHLVEKISEDYLKIEQQKTPQPHVIDRVKLFVLHPKLLRLFLTQSINKFSVLPLKMEQD